MPSERRRRWYLLATSILWFLAGVLPGTLAAQEEGAGEGGSWREAKLQAGGYGSFRGSLGGSPAIPSGLVLRRLVLETEARLQERVELKVELEYERFSGLGVDRKATTSGDGLSLSDELEAGRGSEIALEQAWGQLRLAPVLALRFGAVLSPVGRFNLDHDDDEWDFARRPLIDRGASVLPVPAAWTEMGIGVVGEFHVSRKTSVGYEAYLLNGVSLDFSLERTLETGAGVGFEALVEPRAGAFDGSGGAGAAAGRIRLAVSGGGEYGVSAYAGDFAPGYLATSGVLRVLGLDGRQPAGPIVLEGEALWSHYGGLGRVAEELARVAVEQATPEDARGAPGTRIALSGLSGDRYGFWLDASLPLDLPAGFLGFAAPTLAPVVRYEGVWWSRDLEELTFTGGRVLGARRRDRRQGRLSVGLALRPIPGAVLQLAYERNAAAGGPLLDPQGATSDASALTFGLALGF